ncbi:hypothetical protein CHUAL_011598 [Chamberlinius hualienensis]
MLHDVLMKFFWRGCPQNVVRRMSSGAGSAVPYSKTLKNNKIAAAQNLPHSADVVVIGGGSIGCNTLYHLTKLGYNNVVLLEKDNLTAGTTWHTAGLVWRLRPNDVEVQLLNYTRHLLSEVLEAETGVNPGWIMNGGLFIANNKERLDEYKRLMTLGKVFGVESHVLSPEDTKKLYPLMNVNDLYGTLYSPGDGTVDPAGFCTALAKAASKAGARIFEKTPVVDIDVKEDEFGVRRVTGVRVANDHTIKTSCVVNCAGAWAPYIGQMAGVRVPLVAMKHAYVVTNRIEGIQNMPNVRDHDASVYLRLQGDALSVGGYESNPIFIDKLPKDFGFGLFDLDWNVFECNITGAINRVPILETIGVKSTVCGPESFTPDHKPLMGEDPFLRGYFHGCGFNSAGMMLGGGCGRELARWIVYGRPMMDMYGYDIRRFSPKLAGNLNWVLERSHESYAKNYSMVFKHDEPLAGRNARLDPLHKILQEQGCVFQERLGWERPGWFNFQPVQVKEYDYYGSYGNKSHQNYDYYDALKNDYTFQFPKQHHIIGHESLTCRTKAAIFNMSYFGKFYLTGDDAAEAAAWIFSNDVNKPPGNTVYTCMLNEHGGVEADLTVSTIESGDGSPCQPNFTGNGFYIAAAGGSAFQNYAHILKVIQDKKFRVQLTDLSEEMGLLSIQGPKSREILQNLTAEDFSDDSFPLYTNKIVTVAGHKVRALRMTFVGELGWELHVPNFACVDVYKKAMEIGGRYGLINAGYRAMDSLSIEKGYRHWHADLRLDDTPLEARMAFTCKLKSDIPFLGRTALEKQQKAGVKKLLACLTTEKPVPLFGLEAIYRNDNVVGHVRTAEYGFALNRVVAYGYLRGESDNATVNLDYLKEGTYQIERMGELIPAKFHHKSPFDPNNKRIRGIYDEQLSSSLFPN